MNKFYIAFLILFSLLLSFKSSFANPQSGGCDDNEIYCGEIISLSNLSSGNSFNSNSFQCIPSEPGQYNGNDLLVKFNRFNAEMDNWISVWNQGVDLDIFIFDSCPLTDPNANCIGKSTMGYNVNTGFNYLKFLLTPPHATGDYYILVDAKSNALVDTDIKLSVSCEGLNCESAKPLNCGTTPGDNSIFGLTNAVANYYNCYDGFFEGSFSGKEEIWEFEAPETKEYTFVLDPPNGIDLELFLLNECCESTYDPGFGIHVVTDFSDCFGENNCEDGSTNSSGQNDTTQVYLNAGESVFIIVDGFLGDGGPYELSVNCDGLICDDAIPIDCGNAFYGDNQYGNNNISTYCDDNFDGINTSINLTGKEVIYSITPEFTNDYYFVLSNINPNSDLDMFLLEDCNPKSCLRKSDSGNSNNEDKFTIKLFAGHTYYLIVDGDNNGGMTNPTSTYRLNVNCLMDCDPKRPLHCDIPDYWSNQNPYYTENVWITQPSNISFYTCGNDTRVNLSGPEVSYSFTPPSTGEYTFELSNIENNQDLDIFILTDCDPTSCKGTSDGNTSSASDIITIKLNKGQEYCIIVDGDDGSESEYTLLVSGCQVDQCDFFQAIYEDNFDGSYIDYDLNDVLSSKNPYWWMGEGEILNIGKSGKGVELNNNDELSFKGQLGGTTIMCFDLGFKSDPSGHLLPGNINLSPTDGFTTLINYYFIEWGFDSSLGGNFANICFTDYTGNTSCLTGPNSEFLYSLLNINSSGKSYNTFCIVYNHSTLKVQFYVNDLLFAEQGDAAHTGIVFNGNLCLDNLSYGHCTQCNYFVLNDAISDQMNAQFTNNSDMSPLFVVANGPDGYVDTIDGGNIIDNGYICPIPGYWEYCFWYQNTNGDWEYCCVPYCAYTPHFECEDLHYEYLNYEAQSNTLNYRFNCGEPPIYEVNTDSYFDGPSMYWTINGDRLAEYDGAYSIDHLLPPGEHIICCWHWDYYCGRYIPCCTTICVSDDHQYYPPCLDLSYAQAFNDNPLSFLFSTGNPGNLVYWEIPELSTGQIYPNTLGGFDYTFPDYGMYTICANYDQTDEIIIYEPCCEKICIANPSICEENIKVVPFVGNKFVLENNNDIDVMYWEIHGDNDVLTVYGDEPSIVFPDFGYYTICMYYLDDCCNIQYCCFDFCYYDPFECGWIEPYYIGQDGSLEYNFTLTESSISEGLTAGEWIIDGENIVMGTGNSINYTFTTSGEYTISVPIWDGDCWTICCRRICVVNPFACEFIDVDYAGNPSNPYQYKLSINESNITNITWILHYNGQNIILPGNSHMITVDLQEYGISSGDQVGFTVRYYNPYTRCWKSCCDSICIFNPFACSYLTSMDISTSNQPFKYKFTLSVGSFSDIQWILHRNGTNINLTENTKMIEVDLSDYDVIPGDDIAVTVGWFDPVNKCWKYCCKSIDIVPPQDAVLFNIGEVCGSVGSIISLPVTVNGFNDVSIFGFQLNHISTDIKFKGISEVDSQLAGLSNNTSGIFDNKLIIGWEHPQADKISIPDHTIIFYIDVEILYDFTGEVLITGKDINVYGDNDLIGIVYEGSVCIENVFTITGDIFTEDGESKTGIEVNLEGDISNSNFTDDYGSYLFQNLAQGDYGVYAYNNSNIKNGVNIIDVALIRWHYLQKKILGTDFKKIAGDVDHDGEIDIVDVGLTRRIYLEKIESIPNNTSWRFIPKGLDISANPLDPNLEETISFNPLSQSEVADFTAVKIADVDNSASLNAKSNNPYRYGDFTFSVEDTMVNAGKQLIIPVKVNSFNNIAAFGFEMRWDDSFMSLISISNIQFDQFSNSNYEIKNGRLIVGWDQSTAIGVDFNDGTIFDLIFNINSDASGSTELEFYDMLSIDGDFTAVSIEGSNAEITILPNATNDLVDYGINIFPNPFTQGVKISLESLDLQNFNIQIFNTKGKLVYIEKYDMVNSIYIPESVFECDGIYIIKLSNHLRSLTCKIVKM